MAIRRMKKVKNRFYNYFLGVVILLGLLFCLNVFAQNTDELKIAHVTDVHFSKELDNTPFKLRKQSGEIFDDVIAQINETPGISFVMITGDLVDRAKASELDGFLEHAKNIKYPWYFAFGNHDSMLGGSLTTDKYLEKVKKVNPDIKTEDTYYSFSPKKGFKVIVIDAVIRDRLTAHGYLPQEQIKWLDKELSSAQNQTVIICTHIPILQPIADEHHVMDNGQEVLNVISKYKNPIIVLQGHYHVSKIKQMNNIIFISTPSLVSYPNAFREIIIKNNHDKTTLDIKTKNIRLEKLRAHAKMFIVSVPLVEGEPEDQNGVYTLTKTK
ncbi:metallophosphoesterase [bacterium]|nr:metallophosphoesterase [bacterium]